MITEKAIYSGGNSLPVNVTFKEPEKKGLLFTLYMIVMVIVIAIVNAPGLIYYMVKYRGQDPCVWEDNE